jgi:23S rRNA (guanosine2251-2'-O)-methyltransferase
LTPDLVYGRRAVREALRGRRQVLELWATERAVKSEDWLSDARPKAKADRELTERAETRDHQGVLALVEPFRYADAYALAAAEKPLLAILDRVTDPRNLGAVCRSADGAGATGVIVPAHGSAVVTPAVARASAGAVERRTCDALVSIPLAGEVESLNVSVAAAVILYEARRQRTPVG